MLRGGIGREMRLPPWPGGESREPFGRFPGAPLVTFPALGKSRPPAGAAPAGAEILSRRRQLDEIVGRYDFYTCLNEQMTGKLTHPSPSVRRVRDGAMLRPLGYRQRLQNASQSSHPQVQIQLDPDRAEFISARSSCSRCALCGQSERGERSAAFSTRSPAKRVRMEVCYVS